MSSQELSVVGKSIPRVDALEKVTGKAKFAADFNLPNACYAKLLMSPYPHARILSIDSSQAERLPGVRAVVTGQDPLNKRQGTLYADHYIIARDVARYVGEPVAAVVADTEEIAEEAIGLIKVNYEELPAVFDAEEAMKPDCPAVIHPDALKYPWTLRERWRPCPENRHNAYQYWEGIQGDVEKAFSEADLIAENRFSTPRAHHACIETHHVDAWPEPEGGITIRSKNKAAYSLKAHVVQLFFIPPSKVRIITPYLGGDFGASGGPYPHTIAALLALRSQRPVRLVLSRGENFVTTPHKPPQITYIKDGVKRDGTIIARDIRSITDAGAYTGASNIVTYVSAIVSGAIGLYRFPNFRFRSYGVYTNLPPASAFRGIGQPDLNWALETQMDIIADKLGVDPVELRRKHILKEGEKTCMGQTTHSIGARECMEKVARKLEWDKPLTVGTEAWRRGKGISIGCQATPTHPPAFVHVKLHNDGTIELRHIGIEQGQGTDTVTTQIAAETFGVDVNKIKIVARDTDIVPFGPRTGGSRLTFYLGNAVWRACQDAKRQLFELAAPLLKTAPESLETKEGKIYVRDTPERSIAIGKIFSPSGFIPGVGEILGKGECSVQGVPLDPETGHSERSVAYYSYGAYCVQLAANIETGEVIIEKVAGCMDMGRPINPKMCEAQIEGAIGMGAGVTLYEEILTDSGAILNPSFLDYKLPTTRDMPGINDITPMIGAVPHREGPFGAKAIGEISLTAFYASVGNAVYNATGARIKDLPLTNEKVLKAIKEIESS
ncbi:xanthine dehydrogenase family protein molybdopterin-binding subunit [Chloroflexota bacterium]